MRIKHTPILNVKQIEKVFDENDSGVPDKSNEDIAGQSTFKEYKVCEDINNENEMDSNHASSSSSIFPYKHSSIKEEITIDLSKESTDSTDAEVASTPIANKNSINLPMRTQIKENNTKPSASVEPFNFVKFETATGETFYFNKYLKMTPNRKVPKFTNKRKRIRTAFTDAHLRRLEKEFSKNNYPSTADRAKIAESLNLTDKNVKIWFQNRRIRHRHDNVEMDTDDEASSDKLVHLRKYSSITTVSKASEPSASSHRNQDIDTDLAVDNNTFEVKHNRSDNNSKGEPNTMKSIVARNIKRDWDKCDNNDEISNLDKKHKFISRLVYEDDFSD